MDSSISLSLQVFHGTFDQVAAVVDRDDLHALRQSFFQSLEFAAHPCDGRQRVFAVAHHHDAAGHLAFTVEFSQAAPQFGAEMNVGQLLEIDRRAVGIHTDRNHLQIAQAPDVAGGAHHVFGLAHLHQAPAHVVVAALDGLFDPGQRDVVGQQCFRLDLDLILLDVAADGGDFGHAVHRLQRIAQIPVLDRAQLREIVLAGLVHQRVFVDPADTGGIRPELGRDAGRQAVGGVVEVFEHAGARPVHVGAVLEDHIHHGEAEEGIAAHHLGVGHRQHRRGERVGHLVFHHLRRLPRETGEHDDLHVGKIGDGIQRRGLHRLPTRERDQQRRDQHHETVLDRRVDQRADHGLSPAPWFIPFMSC